MSVSASASASPDDRSERSRLFAIVFLCGACLMALEMAGARLVEPFFGSTIYVWGAIIGLFMGALSIGYFVGGRIADRRPRLPVLGGIILAAGLFTFIAPPLAAPLCGGLNRWTDPATHAAVLDIKVRAVTACLVLYAVPSILMGMVSPFTIRLAARRLANVGGVAGTLYAVSTLGSIVGTFAVSFVLVEFLGSKAIVWGVGTILALLGLYCLLQRKSAGGEDGDAGGDKPLNPKLAAGAVVLALAGIGGGLAGATEPFVPDVYLGYTNSSRPELPAGQPPVKTVLEARESAYHTITILEGDSLIRRDRPARYMMFNDQIESGIDLVAPGGDPRKPAMTSCGYVEMLHLGMLLTEKPPRKSLVIGCGGGLFPLMLRDHYGPAVQRVDVVDIDPWVFAMAEKHFKLPSDDPVIRNYVDDGRLFVEAREDERWDYAVMDAYSSGGRIPKHLVSVEFFRTLRSRLADDGLLLANIISTFDSGIGTNPGEAVGGRLYRSVYKTLAEAFDAGKAGGANLYVFPRSRASRSRPENIILIAAMPGLEAADPSTLKRRFTRLKPRLFSHLGLEPFLDHQLPFPPPTDDVPLLTDDFCPTDRMSAR